MTGKSDFSNRAEKVSDLWKRVNGVPHGHRLGKHPVGSGKDPSPRTVLRTVKPTTPYLAGPVKK